MKSKKFPPEESTTPLDSVVFPNPLINKREDLLGSPSIIRSTSINHHLPPGTKFFETELVADDSLDDLVFQINKADNGYYIVCGEIKKVAKTKEELLEILYNLVDVL